MPEVTVPRCNPKAVGEISEAIVLARLMELGYAVSLPFGNNQRYDFIVDEGGALTRAQVKTGRLRSGNITFRVCSTNGFTGEKRGYVGEADDFLVYCPETREVYRVPVAVCGSKTANLRVDPLSTETHRRVRWAHDHVLDRASRWGRLKPLGACAKAHPDTPARIVERPTKDGPRRHCKECHAVYARQRQARLRADTASDD